MKLDEQDITLKFTPEELGKLIGYVQPYDNNMYNKLTQALRWYDANMALGIVIHALEEEDFHLYNLNDTLRGIRDTLTELYEKVKSGTGGMSRLTMHQSQAVIDTIEPLRDATEELLKQLSELEEYEESES